MSVRIILVSHLGLASGMKKAVEFIVGKQENLYTLEMNEEGAEVFRSNVKYFLEQKETDTIIVSDIPSGSPGSIAYSLLFEQNMNTHLISGMNLPLIIELVLSREFKEVNQLIVDAIDSSQKTIKNLTITSSQESEDEF